MWRTESFWDGYKAACYILIWENETTTHCAWTLSIIHVHFVYDHDAVLSLHALPELLPLARQLQTQRLVHYRTVQIIKSACLGIGSYGAVYKAICDELPCAAKSIHPTLFETNDPGSRKIVERLDKECEFLSGVRHPHIVQYLGVSRDPESGLPVLLMELLDGNLTHFLEQSQEPLPYHVQVSLCHGIALALAYLHSNGIIHRDLSSNNVLLIAGSRAKVTDFGMSKFTDTNPRMTPFTMCPCTMVYMSPEALKEPSLHEEAGLLLAWSADHSGHNSTVSQSRCSYTYGYRCPFSYR